MKARSMRTFILSALTALLATAASAQNAITFWNSIAVQTVILGKASPGGTNIFLAYSNIAAFDAVNAIHPRFQAYGGIQPAAAPDASESAAVAAAVHDVLVNYFPGQAASDPSATPPFVGLDERYADYLASLTESPAAISDGVQVGQQAAAALLALRANDGVFGVSTYVFQTPDPGVYQPTPPFPYPGPLTPWIANMTPFTMNSPAQFLPDEGPPPLSSQEWVDDYNLTKTLGSLTSTVRTSEQTTIGLFWTANPGAAYSSILTDLVSRKSLSTLDSARLFAMVFSGAGDGFIGCMNAKYLFNFWRPVTAIQEGGGNPDTIGDPSWLPLARTPNHPEYPAAHGCVTGAVSSVIADYFGTPNLTLHATVTYSIPPALGGGTQTATRTYSSTQNLLREVQMARIYGGMHYHHSVVQGAVLGHKVAHNLVENYFRPLK